VPLADPEEFERRLLALVRDYLRNADENEIYNDGYEIPDFTVVLNIHDPPRPESALDPWDGGPKPGWGQYVAWTTTMRTDWLREATLEEALQMFRSQAGSDGLGGDGDEDADDDADDE
jgi:hypothetical protein